MKQNISVGIVTYNSQTDIADCISSLTDEVNEIIVVDNASTDSTCDLALNARNDIPIHIIRLEHNMGFGRGCNIALEKAQNDYVLILNPDVRVHNDALHHLREGFHPHCAATVPTIEKDAKLQYSLRKFPSRFRSSLEAILPGKLLMSLSLSEIVTAPRQYTQSHSIDWATGACWLLHKPTVEKIGNYAPEWFLYSEEVDLAKRIQLAGKTIEYIHQARIYHRSGDQHRNCDLYTLAQVNKLLYLKQYTGKNNSITWACFVIGSLLRSSSPHARACLRHLITSRTHLEKLREQLIDNLGGTLE